MARRGKRKGRPVDGLLVVDKPEGVTSNAALQIVKRMFAAAKAGHTGSLDPLATGVLPLCFGEATKFSQFLLEADKRYRTTFRLGISTNTGDADGEVVDEREVPEYDDAHLEIVFAQFRGEIEQVPSMFSAMKVDGQPLYKLAREGIEVERKSRKVTIRDLTLVGREALNLVLDIRCSKGTYVRSLAEDIGEVLGCGAHVSKLRRVESGPFAESGAVSLEQLRAIKEDGGFDALDAMLLPASSAVADWPHVELTDVMALYLKQGQPVMVPQAPTVGWVRIYAEGSDNATEAGNAGERVDGGANSEFLGVGEILPDGRVAPRRLVN